MYKFYFILDNSKIVRYIAVFADEYDEAVNKIKSMKIPAFKIGDWSLKAITEDPTDIVFELEGDA